MNQETIEWIISFAIVAVLWYLQSLFFGGRATIKRVAEYRGIKKPFNKNKYVNHFTALGYNSKYSGAVYDGLLRELETKKIGLHPDDDLCEVCELEDFKDAYNSFLWRIIKDNNLPELLESTIRKFSKSQEVLTAEVLIKVLQEQEVYK